MRAALKADPSLAETNNSDSNDEVVDPSTTNDVKIKAKKKKIIKKGKKNVDFEIVFKGQDGVVTSYKDNEDEAAVLPKKKKKVKEGKIQSEETLEMLMNALKPQSTGA